MESVAAPKLAPEESQATYDTVLNDQPALIKYFRVKNGRARADILSSLESAQALQHPNLIRILQFGETDLAGETVAYAIMERADDNLAAVLRHRVLDADEMREVLDGVLPALEFLHAKGFVHGRIRPANILACGNTVKVSSDRIQSLRSPRAVVDPPGLYGAPETGSGQYSPASDVYSVAVLILEAMTGAPLESGIDRLPAPFGEIVAGGLERDPNARWTLHRIRETLHPEAARIVLFGAEPASHVPVQIEPAPHVPKYRKLGTISIAGVLVAGSACALLVRSAHQAPQAPATPAPLVRTAPHPAPPVEKQIVPAAAAPSDTPLHGHWAIVGAAYRKQDAAEKRARSIRKAHPRLNAEVYPAFPGARRYLIVLGSAPTQADARKQAHRLRTEGAPRNAYVTRLE